MESTVPSDSRLGSERTASRFRSPRSDRSASRLGAPKKLGKSEPRGGRLATVEKVEQNRGFVGAREFACAFGSGSRKRQPWLKNRVTEDPRAAMERAVP